MIPVLGFDPGNSAGLALIDVSASRPVLVRAWGIWGKPSTRWPRFDQAFAEAGALAGPGTMLGIEIPAGGGATSRRTHGWQLSIGRHIGHAEAVARGLCWEIRHIRTNTWTRPAGIRHKKVGEGLHRIDEASRLVDGVELGEPAASKAARERQVCLAEAILIALWAARLTR